MDEVPASPELVKKRKSRRKALHFSKQRTSLSLNRARAAEVQQQDSVVGDATADVSELEETAGAENEEPEIPEQNDLLYFDVDTENIELAFEDPLVSAAILEKANQIEQECTARPSDDFLVNVQNKFVRIDEVIELEVKPGPSDPIPAIGKEPNATVPSKKANYSYTQFDLDTQMIGICEAADILAGLNTNPEQELNDWSSPLKQQEKEKVVHIKTEPLSQIRPKTPTTEEVRRRDRWSNVRQSSLSRKSISIQECRTPPSTSKINISRCITVDFSDESDSELRIDFSKIKSSQLKRRLEKIQSYIDSPPQAVRKTAERRTFSRKKLEKSPHTPVAVRRLSYESTNSERTNGIEMEPAHISSDEEMDCLQGTQQHPQPEDPVAIDSSPDGDNFDSSLLIKANINQLSQFFSQSGPPVTKPNPDSESLNKEPPFFGFPPEPTSPISLPSDPSASPKVLSIAWLFRSEAETESENELDGRNSEEHIHRLLEDDDDFLVQLYSSQRKEESVGTPEPASPIKERSPAREAEFAMPLPPAERCSNRTNIVTSSNETDINHAYPPLEGFQTARGRGIKISESALAKARTIWDDEERKFDGDKAWQTNTTDDNEACAVLAPVPEKPSFGGFCTAGGSKVHISDKALARAEQLWKEEEGNDDIGAPGVEYDKPETALQSFGGFQTAGGSRVTASEKALAKAQHILDQLEHEMRTEDILPDQVQGESFGFQTALGSTVKVSDDAMSKAQSMLRRIELDLENELNDPLNGKPRTIPKEDANKPTTAEDGSCVKRLRDGNDSEPETPLKKYKPEARCNNAVHQFSTSTPNIHGKAIVPTSHHNGKHELDHFFGDLDDHEFQQLFSGMDPTGTNSRRFRPMKQVRLTSRFDECDNVSADEHNLPGGIPWDDSFGDVVTKLNSDEGLRVAQQILEARQLCRQRQQSYIENKPSDERRPRLTEFIKKKQLSGRKNVRQFVESNTNSGEIGVVSERLRHVNADNAKDFKFDMIQLYGKTECLENMEGISLGDPSSTTRLLFNDRCQVGLPELKAAFLASPGVDPALIPTGWIENCWVWIIIKLTSMECQFPECFSGITTPENVFNQLMYRYHIEIDNAKRSVIRKMLEKDDIASKRMVLFVSRIFRGSVPFEAEIELCDGWYAIRTVLDFPLTQAVLRGKVTIGTKLMIQGAELINLSEGCSPLEVPADVRLKIHANSTRRAKWDTRLGVYKVPLNFVISSNDVLEGGGLIASLEIIILRVYPIMFVDKTQRDAQGAVKGDRASTVLRSERVERRRALESDSNRFENFQALFSQVQREVQAESVQQNGRSSLLSKLTRATTTAELLELVDAGLDLSCLEIEFSSTQREAIINLQRRKQEECFQEVNRRIRERMNGADSKRKVSSLLKLRIADARKPDKVLLLSIWRPPEDHCDMFQEGRVLEMRNASANGIKNGEVQLTAGKISSFKILDLHQYEPPVRLMRTLTKIADIETTGFRPMFNEFDTIGIVIQVGTIGNKNFQTVYLADTDQNLLGVHFWSSIKEYAYEDVVKEHVVLCISNLQWRTNNAHNVIPTAFATECTTFSEHSKSKHFVEEFQSFHAFLKDRDLQEFYDECSAKIAELKDVKLPRSSSFNTPLRNNSTTTPMRSILTSVNPNATTTLSPGVRQPASLQKRKLEQLAAYKSPPKLSPIIMRYNPKVRKDFKTPSKLEDRINQIDRDDSVC